MKREHAVLGRESILLILTSLKEKKTAKCFRQIVFIIWMVVSSFKYNWIITVLSRIETIPAIKNIKLRERSSSKCKQTSKCQSII